jgi:hypothetical protein
MTPPDGWYALQLCFAERAAMLTGLPFEEAALQFTNCYRRFGLGRSRDRDHPIWQAYLRGLRMAADRAAWTAEYARDHEPPAVAEFFGCFHYDYVPETQQVRLHFANHDSSDAGPLSHERSSVRHAELGALFSALAQVHPEALTVRGVSWLHGTGAYRRLFPPEYGASATPIPAEQVLASMPLWGQFLDHADCVKENLASTFLACVARATSFAELVACFPLQVYAVECDI